MLRATSGQIVNFRFGFLSENSYYDPISNSPPVDVVASVLRGLDGYGETIESTKSLLKTSYKITSINIVSASQITNPQNPNFGYAVVSYTFLKCIISKMQTKSLFMGQMQHVMENMKSAK